MYKVPVVWIKLGITFSLFDISMMRLDDVQRLSQFQTFPCGQVAVLISADCQMECQTDFYFEIMLDEHIFFGSKRFR